MGQSSDHIAFATFSLVQASIPIRSNETGARKTIRLTSLSQPIEYHPGQVELIGLLFGEAIPLELAGDRPGPPVPRRHSSKVIFSS